MTVTAIIAEYNPFHSGHKYHIEQARKLTNADVILVIMSGNFVQRGEPAVFDKHLRSKLALENGADIILELPYPYSCSSAEYFAEAAVTILNKLGCINYLCFGSECDNISAMTDIAKVLVSEPSEYKEILKEHLKTGLSFPKARQLALETVLGSDGYKELLTSPNNILGIEYIKALTKLNSTITPITIKRAISSYHHNDDNNPLYSASSIRKEIFSKNSIELANISPLYQNNPLYAMELNDLGLLLAGKLLENSNCLDKYLDISGDLAGRIRNNIDNYVNPNDFINLIKTKNITYTSISRALCHLMLNMKKCDMETLKNNGYCDYVRILKFNDIGSSILKIIEGHGKIKVVTGLSKIDAILSDLAEYNRKLFEYSLNADNLYRLAVQSKFNVQLANEYQHKFNS